jgi:hypothetical protein
VAVTLANDLDTPEKGAVAYNTLTVRTQVDSIRIRAAKRSGAAITEPFPYQLSLSEYPNSAGGDPLGSIAIDAVAASSFPILLAATGNLDFNATLATAGGLTVTGVNAFTVTAPVSTTKGQIKIDAAAIKSRLDGLGLAKHLSSNRTQGLASMIGRIEALARAADGAPESRRA